MSSKGKIPKTLTNLAAEHLISEKGMDWIKQQDIPEDCKNICETLNWNPLEILLLENPDKPWDWEELSRNIDISIEFIVKHSDMNWDWGLVTKSLDSDNWEKIYENPNLPWDFKYLSLKKTFDIKFIRKYPDKDWNWRALSSRKINPDSDSDSDYDF